MFSAALQNHLKSGAAVGTPTAVTIPGLGGGTGGQIRQVNVSQVASALARSGQLVAGQTLQVRDIIKISSNISKMLTIG